MDFHITFFEAFRLVLFIIFGLHTAYKQREQEKRLTKTLEKIGKPLDKDTD